MMYSCESRASGGREDEQAGVAVDLVDPPAGVRYAAGLSSE